MDDITKQPYAKWLEESIATIAGIDPCCICFAATKADGTVFTGCNIENAAYGCTICAERTAACKAVSEGRRDFVRIAVYGDGEHYCYPCGACRQFLAEFAPDMEVLSAMGGGRYVSNRLSELMPYTFNY